MKLSGDPIHKVHSVTPTQPESVCYREDTINKHNKKKGFQKIPFS